MLTETQLRASARPSHGPDALATARSAGNGTSRMAAQVRTTRPRQWTKNHFCPVLEGGLSHVRHANKYGIWPLDEEFLFSSTRLWQRIARSK